MRILNPVEFGDGSIMLWSDIVERNGLEPSPWMQWDELTAHLGAALSPDNAEPAMGDPHPSLATALIRELRVSEDRYYFASWVGYAEASSQATIDHSPSGREMALYSGALIDETGSARLFLSPTPVGFPCTGGRKIFSGASVRTYTHEALSSAVTSPPPAGYLRPPIWTLTSSGNQTWSPPRISKAHLPTPVGGNPY